MIKNISSALSSIKEKYLTFVSSHLLKDQSAVLTTFFRKRPYLFTFLCTLFLLLLIIAVVPLLKFIAGLLFLGNTGIFKDDESIRNIGLALPAIYSLPFLVWRSLIAAKNAQTSKLNQINEAYTAAITQLGAVHKEGKNPKPHIEIRLGGIYALENLAKNNKELHPQIMEVLCSYVRTNSPISEEDSGSISIDIQTILTVIGRRNVTFNEDPLNLSYSNLTGANLVKANLKNAYLDYADLENVRDIDCRSLQKAKNWQFAYRGESLACGADIPTPK